MGSRLRRTLLVMGDITTIGLSFAHVLPVLGDDAFNIVAVVPPEKEVLDELAAWPHVTVHQTKYMYNPPALFAELHCFALPIWGMLCVQVRSDWWYDEMYGRALVDMAASYQVRHIVCVAVEASFGTTGYGLYISMTRTPRSGSLERYLRATAERSASLTYTLLWPAVLMERLGPGVLKPRTPTEWIDYSPLGRAFAAIWQQRDDDAPLPLLAAADLGWFAAQACLRADDSPFRNRVVPLAGDQRTFSHAVAVFAAVLHRQMPLAGLGLANRVLFDDETWRMIQWVRENSDASECVEACRAEHPALLDFRAWLQQYESP